MFMTMSVLAFGLAFAVALLITPLVRRLALCWGVVDRPDHFRKIHTGVIPRLGGFAIFTAFLGTMILFSFVGVDLRADASQQSPQVLALLLGALVALGLGAIDDVLDLPARWKLFLQVVAATVAFIGGYRIAAVSNPFGHPFVLGWLSYPATVLWFLACMNAINLLDGLDGLAAGASLFAGVTLFMVSASAPFQHGACMFLMACLCGSILGFLFYNFYPASIFLGDSGTMVLGYLIAALSLLQTRKAEAALALLVPLIALGVPLFDTVLAVLRRWSRRLPISAADRQHVHHILISLGLSHRKAVLLLYAVCLLLGGAAYLIAVGRNEVTLVLLGSLAIVAFVSVRTFGGMRVLDLLSRVSEDLERLRRSTKARHSAQKAFVRMGEGANVEDVWGALVDVLPALDVDFARLRLHGDQVNPPHIFTWPRGMKADRSAADLGPDLWAARFTFVADGAVLGELEIGKAVNARTLFPEAPEILERLRGQMQAQFKRLLFLPAKGRARTLPGARGSTSVGHQVP